MNVIPTRTHTHIYTISVFSWRLRKAEDSLVITSLFSSLFVWKLKCSLGATLSSLVWLKRLSSTHSFQHSSAEALTPTHTHTSIWGCKYTKHTRKHTPKLLYNIFLWAHNALLAARWLSKVQAFNSWCPGYRARLPRCSLSHTHTHIHPYTPILVFDCTVPLPNVSLQWGTDCSHFSCKLTLSLTPSPLLCRESYVQ